MLNEYVSETIQEIVNKDSVLGKTPKELAPVIDLLKAAAEHDRHSRFLHSEVRRLHGEMKAKEKAFKVYDEKAEVVYEAALNLMPNGLTLAELKAYLEIQAKA